VPLGTPPKAPLPRLRNATGATDRMRYASDWQSAQLAGRKRVRTGAIYKRTGVNGSVATQPSCSAGASRPQDLAVNDHLPVTVVVAVEIAPVDSGGCEHRVTQRRALDGGDTGAENLPELPP
jgi:hypothetical protein